MAHAKLGTVFAPTPSPCLILEMDHDPPPPPYSRRVSRAVILDQNESFIKGIDELSSRMREVTTLFDAVAVDIRRHPALKTNSLGALRVCQKVCTSIYNGFKLA
jgi:hypothetical protein